MTVEVNLSLITTFHLSYWLYRIKSMRGKCHVEQWNFRARSVVPNRGSTEGILGVHDL